jgi:undecaprenyl-diphosphatase
VSEILKAAILGIVQGITEFLPISSSAHLHALERILDFHLEGLAFDVALHFASLLAVIGYFHRDILDILKAPERLRVALNLIIATVPIGVCGLLLKDVRENISSWVAVGGWTFSGIYLLLSRTLGGTISHREVRPLQALGVGLAPTRSIFPGVSRSGSSITMGLWLGLSREGAARFSFLIAIPAILGASAHEGLDLARHPETLEGIAGICLVGMVLSLGVGLLAIHVLLKAVRSRNFHLFGIYNLLAAAFFAAYLIASR